MLDAPIRLNHMKCPPTKEAAFLSALPRNILRWRMEAQARKVEGTGWLRRGGGGGVVDGLRGLKAFGGGPSLGERSMMELT